MTVLKAVVGRPCSTFDWCTETHRADDVEHEGLRHVIERRLLGGTQVGEVVLWADEDHVPAYVYLWTPGVEAGRWSVSDLIERIGQLDDYQHALQQMRLEVEELRRQYPDGLRLDRTDRCVSS